MRPAQHTLLVLCALSCSLFHATSALRILGIFPHPGKSHVDVFVTLMRGLAARGHHVTVLSHFPLERPEPRYRDLSLGDPADTVVGSVDVTTLAPSSRLRKYFIFLELFDLGRRVCRTALASDGARALLRSDERFDVVIAEFFNSDCLLGFVWRSRAPLVGLSSCTVMPYTNARFANPLHPAYVPNNFMDYTDRLTFLERAENAVVSALHQLYADLVVGGWDDAFIREHFGDDVPPVRDIFLNSSLLLVNSHFSLNLPRPQVPAVIDVGGIHVREPKKLPDNIEKWINESTEGVVYFSLGSVIKGHTFPEEKKRAFLRAFGRLPQRVLWKWENNSMPGKPDNVMIQRWMPQLDILCHPNVKAFVSHGGLLGTIEAVHCGVPVVVMPQFGDQFTNARALEANGGGVILHLHEATEDTVYKALKKVLRLDFKKQAEELSARFRDRPMSPLDTAVYWVEYVARHKGAPFMRTAAVGMPWYRYLLLDVVAFLVVVLTLVAVAWFYTARAALRLCRRLLTRATPAAAAADKGKKKVKSN